MKPLIITDQQIEELGIDKTKFKYLDKITTERDTLLALYVIDRDSALGMWLLLAYPDLCK